MFCSMLDFTTFLTVSGFTLENSALFLLGSFVFALLIFALVGFGQRN